MRYDRDFYWRYWDSIYPTIEDVNKALRRKHFELNSLAVQNNKLYKRSVINQIKWLKEYRDHRVNGLVQMSFDFGDDEDENKS